MYELLTYPAGFGEPSGSPFCVKAMCLLKMAGAGWRRVDLDDPRRMPHGKLPVLRDGGTLIPDSEGIRAFLETEGADFDAGLDVRDRAHARALVRLADEHLYFALLLDRWGDDAVWAKLRDAYFGSVPKLVRGPVASAVRRTVLRNVRGQGMGRLTDAERLARVDVDLRVIAALLAERDFLFGDAPCSADCSVGPMIAAIAAAPVETALARRVRDDAALAAYIERVRDALYP